MRVFLFQLITLADVSATAAVYASNVRQMNVDDDDSLLQSRSNYQSINQVLFQTESVHSK